MTTDEIQEVAMAQVMCRSSLLFHTRYFFKHKNKRKYKVRYHHQLIANALEDVIKGKTRRLAISLAPRLGKTELAVIQFIAHSLALNPQAKFILLSASDSLALENSESIKDYIKSPEYQLLFPHVRIKYSTDSKKKWYTEAGGGVYALGAAGQVTGFGAGLSDGEESPDVQDGDDLGEWLEDIDKDQFGGAIVYDDPMKPEDGNSDVVRSKINRRYVSTVKNRVNSRRTPIVIIAQRLNKQDLIGYVQEIEPEEWKTLVIPELYVDAAGEVCCLDDTIRTVKDLQAMEANQDDEVRYIFQTQHQQNPMTREGLLFSPDDLRWYDPTTFDAFKNSDMVFQVIDPADQGEDSLSGPYVAVCGREFYVFDTIFNKYNADVNQPAIVAGVEKYKVKRINFEAQSAWRIMLSNLQRAVAAKRLNCEVYGFTSKDNKHTRILSEAGFIKNHFHFRKDWQTCSPEYRAFIIELTGYLVNQSGGGNKHDDAPDSMAMAADHVQKNLGHLLR